MTLPKITSDSIIRIEKIRDRPVFFLTLKGIPFSKKITVKGEQRKDGGEVSLKWSSKMMKNVNSSKVNSKIMEPHEVAAFKIFVQTKMKSDPQAQASMSGALNWVKMPFVEKLSDAELWKKDKDKNYVVHERDIRELLRHFSHSSTWKQIGKVLAVDIFNGNQDRFDFTTGDWVNQGNLMFQSRLGGHKVIGLDTFDPNSPVANLDAALTDSTAQHLEIISREEAMLAFAGKVTKGLGIAIESAMRKASVDNIVVKSGSHAINIDTSETNMEEIFTGYIEDLQAGIKAGAAELKDYLNKKQAKYSMAPTPPSRFSFGNHRAPAVTKALPAGVVDRMTRLGW